VIGPFKWQRALCECRFGFHSNDARAATIAVDPATGEPADRGHPLVRAKGAEVGFRKVRFRICRPAWRCGRCRRLGADFRWRRRHDASGLQPYATAVELRTTTAHARGSPDADLSLVVPALSTSIHRQRHSGSCRPCPFGRADGGQRHNIFGSVPFAFGPRRGRDNSERSKATTL